VRVSLEATPVLLKAKNETESPNEITYDGPVEQPINIHGLPKRVSQMLPWPNLRKGFGSYRPPRPIVRYSEKD